MMLMMAGGGNMQRHRPINKKPYVPKKPVNPESEATEPAASVDTS